MKFKRKYLIFWFLCLFALSLWGRTGTEQEIYKKAQNFEQKGEYVPAESLYVELYSANPDNYNYFNRYKNLLIRQKKYSDLVPLLENRLSKRDYDRYLKLEISVLYYILDMKPKAIDLWEEVFKSQTKNLKDSYANAVYYDLITYGQVNRLYEVVDDLRRITSDPRLLVDHNFAISLKYSNWDDAVSEILHILKIDPDDLRYVRPNLFRYDPDSELYVRVIDALKEKDQPESVILLSDIYSHIAEFQKAYDILDKHLNEGSLGSAMMNFADRMFKQGEYELSYKAAHRIEKIISDDVKKRSMAFLAARSKEKIFDQVNKIDAIIPYPYDSEFMSIRFKPFNPETAKLIKNAYDVYDSLSYYPDFYGELAAMHHADLTYRVYQDFDGALEEYFRLIGRSGVNSKEKIISKICDLYMARGEFAKALEFCVSAPSEYRLMVHEEDRLSLHLFYVSLMNGEKDSLVERTSSVLAVLQEDDPLYNDILGFSGVLNTVLKDSLNYNKWLEAEKYLLQNNTASAIDIYKDLIRMDSPAKKIYALRLLDCLNSQKDIENEEKFWIEHYSALLKTDLGDYFMLRYAGYLEKMKKFDNSYEIFEKYLLSYKESMYYEQIREHVRQHYSPGKP